MVWKRMDGFVVFATKDRVIWRHMGCVLTDEIEHEHSQPNCWVDSGDDSHHTCYVCAEPIPWVQQAA